MTASSRVVSRGTLTETDERRLTHERALLAEARESVARGDVVPDAEIEAWLDRMVAGEEAGPIPPRDPANNRS